MRTFNRAYVQQKPQQHKLRADPRGYGFYPYGEALHLKPFLYKKAQNPHSSKDSRPNEKEKISLPDPREIKLYN